MENTSRRLSRGDENNISECHANSGFEGEIESVSELDENNQGSLEDTEDQSTLKADKNGSIDGIGTSHENSLNSSQKQPAKRPMAAVIVRNAVKSYGSGPKVLNNFSMTVEKGTIYSLLGSSGCGKTTLLSCVVGIKNISEGEIQVFGAKPGTKESGIPGKRVGYMPQEVALYNDFSIKEALRYFGTIYGMGSSEIQTSINFLVDFLDLPDQERRIGTLSGGQKRRTSLAMSLVHSPELLILDEPTVGVDPLLRESIWSHLVKLVSKKDTTVIITTHYIEEARQSNMIGLMRGGRLLAENSPTVLLQEHNTTLLEDIVLKLCRNDKFGNDAEEDNNYKNDNDVCLQDVKAESRMIEPYAKDNNDSQQVNGNRRISMMDLGKVDDSNEYLNSINRLKALVLKNFLVMTRNMLLIMFMILLPAVQVAIICLALGNDPKPLRMGVVNHETNYSVCLGPDLYIGDGCDVENLSCKFLAKLPRDVIYLREYETEEIARQAVREGKVWGFMSFPEGYSDHVYTRSSSGNIVDNDTLQGSNIIFEMDLSNKQIAVTMKRIFYDGYKDFVKDLLSNCGFHPELGEVPIKYVDPIYGKDDTDFREYVAPSMLLGILFFFPLCSSSVSYIWDKKQGTLERSLVAGVQLWEIMLSFFFTEGCVLLIQIGLSYTLIVSVFGIIVQGSVTLFILMCILMGFSGISLGFLIASICKEEIQAVLLAIATFFPNVLLAGMMWPTQGMPLPLQYFSYVLPCTLASETIRSIISRGWGLFHIGVWPGFVTSLAWTAVYWTGTIMINRAVRSRQ